MKAILIFSLLIVYSCGQQTGTNESGQFRVQKLDAENVSFAELKKELIGPMCISCHSEYADERVVLKEKAKILAEIKSGRMPMKASPLNKTQIGYITKYLDGIERESERGRVVNPTSPDPTIPYPTEPEIEIEVKPDLAPTYASLKYHLLEQYKCLKCHSGSNDIRLDSEKLLIKYIEDVSFALESDSMPVDSENNPSGPVSQDVKDAFTEWKDSQN
jgi:hypothetical protein